MAVEMNFIEDFAIIAADKLVEFGFEPGSSADPEKVLHQYLSYLHRLIPAIPRTIHKPEGFHCPEKYAQGLRILEEKIRMGENLQPYQSRKITSIDYKDMMLNDWGIHHLHLGVDMEISRPFIKGTKDVLFALFNKGNAYFLTIAGHSSWSEIEMIKIIHDNFPHVIESWRLKDVIGLSSVPDNETIRKYRGAQINSPIEIYPGVVYIGPGGGYAADGTNIKVVMKLNDFFHFSSRIEKNISKDEDAIRAKMTKILMKDLPGTLKLKIFLIDETFYIKEIQTETTIRQFSFNEIQ